MKHYFLASEGRHLSRRKNDSENVYQLGKNGSSNFGTFFFDEYTVPGSVLIFDQVLQFHPPPTTPAFICTAIWVLELQFEKLPVQTVYRYAIIPHFQVVVKFTGAYGADESPPSDSPRKVSRKKRENSAFSRFHSNYLNRFGIASNCDSSASTGVVNKYTTYQMGIFPSCKSGRFRRCSGNRFLA